MENRGTNFVDMGSLALTETTLRLFIRQGSTDHTILEIPSWAFEIIKTDIAQQLFSRAVDEHSENGIIDGAATAKALAGPFQQLVDDLAVKRAEPYRIHVTVQKYHDIDLRP